MPDIVTFGELMLKLTAPGKARFSQTDYFDMSFGGADANVAVALSNYGMDTYFVSRFPKHDIGEAAMESIRKYGVDTSFCLRGGDRLGVYYLENGVTQRSSKVIYDRKYSSVNGMDGTEVDWEAVFDGKDWFHWTGITPALSKNLQKAVFTACTEAKKADVTVSCDLNYRSKLWSEPEAQQVMIPLMEFVDVCIANEWHSRQCLDFEVKPADENSNEVDIPGSIELARELKSHFGFQSVVITLRESFSASTNAWSAVFHDDKDCREPVRSTRYEFDIVDRVGGGDAFAAGLIYGLLNLSNTKDALEFGAGACCIKHTIPGDFNLASVEEIETMIQSNGAGRIDR